MAKDVIYTINRESDDNATSWTNTVSGVVGYRTDLASGITAAEVPYSAANVNRGTITTTTLASGNITDVNTTAP